MTTATFSKIASVVASTKRAPDVNVTTGKAGAPVIFIDYLECFPPVSVSSPMEWRETLQLKTLVNLLETYVQGDLDIIAGDVLTINGKDYPVRFVNTLPWGRKDTRLQLILEDLKR
jgi:hypothetical protein